jgi:molybdopterin-binding protein
MDNQGPISFPLISSDPMWNHVDGRVISILYGLTRTTVKVMSEDEVILTVRCPSEKFEQVNVRIGQQVTAQVNAHNVLLGMAGMSFGKERWNRWSGRIVLVNSRDSASLITVKLQGKGCTLTSTGPVIGQSLRPEVLEPVSIVIDPENVTLTPHMFATHDTTIRAHERHRVWLKARIEAVRKSASGSVVSLNVGGTHISALVCGDQDIPYEWAPGLPVEMHVDQWEAWLRPAGDGIDAVMCKLMYETSL